MRRMRKRLGGRGLLGAGLLAAALGTTTGIAATGPVDPQQQEAILAERDALIDKIAHGVDLEASIERFAVLYSSKAAEKRAREEAEERERMRQAAMRAVQSSPDFLVGEHCVLSADPKNPDRHTAGDSWRTDWGKVVRKEVIRTAPKNAFDEGEELTMYLIEGAQKTYTVSGKGPAYLIGKPLSAKVGDLVFLCMTSMESHGSGSPYPPDFRNNILSNGFALRIKEPPHIVNKQKWNPLHIASASRLRMAITQVKWHYPEDRAVVAHLLVEREWTDAPPEVPAPPGITRYLITAERESFVLEVPSKLKGRELLQPSTYVWAIMTRPRFDKALRKLVLTAEDLEAQYIVPADPPPGAAAQ